MSLEKFRKIRLILTQAESLFPVDDWTVNGIHIWPILRNRIFISAINNFEVPSKKNNELIKTKETEKTNMFFLVYCFIINTIKYLLWLLRIKQKDYLFVGSDMYRVNLEGKRFNRFFDSMILKKGIADNSSVLEYHIDKKNHFFEKTSIDFIDNLKLYENSFYKIYYTRIKKNTINIKGYQGFIDHIQSFDMTKKIADEYTLEQIVNYHSGRWVFHYENAFRILKRIKPKEVYTLCYYNNQVMLLVAAAKKAEIKVVEMQHGPITTNHLAYGSWTKLPDESYNTIPNHFWCWDEMSKKCIDSSLGKNKMNNSFVGGHLWVQYWRDKLIEKESINTIDKFILCTLQELPLEDLFTERICQLIIKSKIKWYVRLHPRQISKLKSIEVFLENKGVLNYIEVRQATELPLPLLLSKAIINVTLSSGATIEASMFNVYTILLDSLSMSYYSEIIDKGLAEYLDVSSEQFETKFNEIVLKNVKDD